MSDDLVEIGVVTRGDDRVIINRIDSARGVRKRVQIDCSRDGLTEQSHKKSCDINYIIKKYEKTGLLEHLNEYGGQYSDVSTVDDYLSGQLKVKAAQDAFMSLPASLRKRFENDPAKFLAFAQDENNKEEMYELGLAIRPRKYDAEVDKASVQESSGETPVAP